MGPPSVLVVDDDKEIRDLFRLMLTRTGYGVRLAANGKEALEQVNTSAPPDALILDLQMPIMSGFEVLSALRSNPKWARIPIVVVTAVSGYSAAGLGVRAILMKPFNLIDVQAALHLALSESAASQSQ